MIDPSRGRKDSRPTPLHPDEKVGPDFNIVIMDPPKVRKTELMIPVH
jgi:hypothetical protein